MHNRPGLPAGHFGLRRGPIMAAGSRFRITVTGKGAHAAQPHLGLDPIPLACSMVLQCQTVSARHKDPVDPAVISVWMMHAGDTDNVIPDSAELRGTIRTLSSVLQQKLQRDIQSMCEGLAGAYGAQVEVNFFEYYPATINTPAETELCETVIRDAFGVERVRPDVPANMTSEDFDFMLEESARHLCTDRQRRRRFAGFAQPEIRLQRRHYPDRRWVLGRAGATLLLHAAAEVVSLAW